MIAHQVINWSPTPRLWILSDTVPFHLIWQSCIIGPSKMLKCHSCYGNFYGVPNLFSNHVITMEIFLLPAALDCLKFWACHSNFRRLLKPNFWHAHYASQGLLNWLKWYSNPLVGGQSPLYSGEYSAQEYGFPLWMKLVVVTWCWRGLDAIQVGMYIYVSEKSGNCTGKC